MPYGISSLAFVFSSFFWPVTPECIPKSEALILSTSFANPSIVGFSKTKPSGASTTNAFLISKIKRVAKIEWPPKSKKFSFNSIDDGDDGNKFFQMSWIVFWIGVNWRSSRALERGTINAVSGKGKAGLSIFPFGFNGIRVRGMKTVFDHY